MVDEVEREFWNDGGGERAYVLAVHYDALLAQVQTMRAALERCVSMLEHLLMANFNNEAVPKMIREQVAEARAALEPRP